MREGKQVSAEEEFKQTIAEMKAQPQASDYKVGLYIRYDPLDQNITQAKFFLIPSTKI